jgi:pilus assembly protein Flp/PilA
MLQNVVLKIATTLQCRKGVSALEYGILAAAIITAVVGALTNFTTDLTTLFDDIGTKLKTAGDALK